MNLFQQKLKIPKQTPPLQFRLFTEKNLEDVNTIVQACAYLAQTTVPSNSPYSTVQLTFRRDMTFCKHIVIDWGKSKQQCIQHAMANKNKESKNESTTPVLSTTSFSSLHCHQSTRNIAKYLQQLKHRIASQKLVPTEQCISYMDTLRR